MRSVRNHIEPWNGWRVAIGVITAVIGLWAHPGAASEIQVVPRPVLRTLENGLRVAVFAKPRLPIVQIQLIVPAGSAAEPAQQGGIANLCAEMLRHGTTSRDATLLSAELDRLGGNLNLAATRDYAAVSGAFLARDFDAGLELLSDVVLNPAFPGPEFERVKAQAQRGVALRQQVAALVADDQLWSLAFGQHVHGRPLMGTPPSIQRLTREQTQAFYRDHYRPDQAVLAIAGDVTPDRAFAAAQEWFGRWTGKAIARERTTPPPPVPGTLIRVVNRPDLQRAELRLGLIVPGRAAAEELPLSVANLLLGGGLSSRLARLAEQGVLGREVRSAVVTLEGVGVFSIAGSSAPDSVARFVDQVQGALRRFAEVPPDPEEVRTAKRSLHDSFPLQFETLGSVIGNWLAADFYGQPADYFDRYPERIEALTAADIAAVAHEWLTPTRLAIVAVGPASTIKSQLERLGRVEVVGPEAEAAVTPAPPAAAVRPATAAERARGREVIRKAVLSHGGLARLRGIKDSRIEASITLAMGGRELRGTLTQIRKEPYKMVNITRLVEFETRQTLNDKRAWAVAESSELQDLDSLSVAALRAGFSSDVPHLLLGASDPRARVAARGRVKVAGIEALAVEVVSPDSAQRTLYFDLARYRLIAMDQRENEGGDAGFLARRVYRDQRLVNGILWPHIEQRMLNGERVMDVYIQRVALNAGVDESMFEKPEAALEPPSR